MARKLAGDRFLLFSRIDFLGKGYRQGLLEAMAKVAVDEEVDAVLLCGGLVSYKGWRDLLKSRTANAIEWQKELKERQKGLPKDDREYVPTQVEVRKQVKEDLLNEVADMLADSIPEIPGPYTKPLKIYITLSPANNYDGKIGPEIAERLQRRRDDISLWGLDGARFELKKNEGGALWVVNPTKAAWRSKYFSTSADRIVEDKTKQTSLPLPTLWVVGTGASAINRPAGGETPRPLITVPALSRLQEVHTSENQVGVSVVEVVKESRFPVVRTYNFKDLVANERDFIPVPDGVTKMQRAILREVIRSLPTIGMLEDALPWKRSTIERAIKKYNEAGRRPQIVCDENSGRYNVSYSWLQFDLSYSVPSLDRLNEDSFIGFCCLHAGYKNTQYKWFVNRLPELILENDIQALVSCGDFIAGLKHNLHLRGEVYAGMNYTQQEELAAELAGSVLARVFAKRFDAALSRKRKEPGPKTLKKIVEESLMDFYFWRGNHDEWVQDDGIEPLATFRMRLKAYLVSRVLEHLAKRGHSFSEVESAVSGHLHYAKEHTSPSGITMSVRHPHQGRMQTSSGRAQQTMWATEGQFVPLGNFHTAVAVHEWDSDSGQRLALQLGTIARGTDFEDNMNKLVDTGVGMARIWSDPDTHRILATEVIWDSPDKDEIIELDDNDVIDAFKDELDL